MDLLAAQQGEQGMSLIKCFECGAGIADTASQCARCRSHHVKGVACVLCGERMKASSSVISYMVDDSLHVHRRCAAHLFGHRGRCRECGRAMWGTGLISRWTSDLIESVMSRSGGQFRETCRGCGVPNPLEYLGICVSCRLPIYARLHDVGPSGSRHGACESPSVGAG